MKCKLLASVFLLVIAEICDAQAYRERGKNRYTFAQTTFGYDMEYTPGSGNSYFRNAQNQLQRIPIGKSFAPAISIAGLHFWGRAEFFTTFSLPDIDLVKDKTHGEYQRFSSTGFKYFIRPVRTNTLSPYLGMSLSSFSYKQAAGVQMKRADGSFLGGLTWLFKRGMLEIGCNYHYRNSYNYYISPAETVPVKVPRLSFSADYKYFFDLSVSSLNRERKGELKQEYDRLKKRNALSSISVAMGPAYSFFCKTSGYNKTYRPFLDNHRVTVLYPDIGIGYYNFRLDAMANFSVRFFRSTLSAYGYTQVVKRNSYALEGYKFLADYHGFVPFVGAIASYEKYKVTETENGRETFVKNYSFLSPGFIAGWDIRPTRTDWWGVRTNIRYFPFLSLSMPGNSKLYMQQVELNFLQMVLYPGRIYALYLKK